MKVYTIQVLHCANCPALGGDRRSGRYCSQTGERVDDVQSLPDWCPLPDDVPAKAPVARKSARLGRTAKKAGRD